MRWSSTAPLRARCRRRVTQPLQLPAPPVQEVLVTTLPPSGSESRSSFDRLHPKVQQWIWHSGWNELRPAQAAAVTPIVGAKADVILSAATASGKTEAAFLPICSSLAFHPASEPGIEVLYLSPLKALINDQFDRLTDMFERIDVSVHRWHGDVSGSRKQKVLRNPSGLVLMTPESLEALFVRRGTQVQPTFAALRYVVIDELHAFIGTERGAQLQSLLNRLELATRPSPGLRCRPRSAI